MRRHVEKKWFGLWVHFGYSFRRIDFQFSIDRWSFEIAVLFVYFGIEF
jgi:hypothetical protein